MLYESLTLAGRRLEMSQTINAGFLAFANLSVYVTRQNRYRESPCLQALHGTCYRAGSDPENVEGDS
jgi:hypothetical protein